MLKKFLKETPNQKFRNILIVVITTLVLLSVVVSVLEKSEENLASFWSKITERKNETELGNDLSFRGKGPEPYAPAVDYEGAIIKAVEEGSKSVVSIVISKDLPILERCPYNPFGNLGPEFDDFFGRQFAPFYTQCNSGKTEKQEIGGGSGFIIREDGLILTNKHVVSDAKAEYTVIMSDGKTKYPAKVLARDPSQDIAIIKIDRTGLTAAKLGDSSSIRLGQTAIAIGNALAEFRNTVSLGIISGLSRKIIATGGTTSERISNLIQTDAAINHGNSGGPLLNLRGEVIGINTAIAASAQNIGFAIPINEAKKAIESVEKTGTIKTAFLGVRYTMITEEMATAQNLPIEYGALLRGNEGGPAVIIDSPADKAGLMAEDIIIEVNGEKVDEENPLANIIQKYSVGETVSLKVQRGKEVLSMYVILAERPNITE